jgi:protein O-mannosyl-transferase
MTARTRTAGNPTSLAASPQNASRWRRTMLGALLWCLVFLTYVPSTFSGFIWDDDDYVTENPTLRSVDGLRRIWLDPEATPQYYPFVFTTFWVEHHLWGLNPAGYHLTNAALHATNALLAWMVLRRLSLPGAWLAGALFGLHPVHVESVSWVTERKNVLSACFFLLAMRLFLGSLSAPAAGVEPDVRRFRWKSYSLGVAFFIAALLSKSVTCTLPAVLLFLQWWRLGRLKLRDTAPLVPLFLIGVVFALNTARLERTHVGATGPGFDWTACERFLIAGRALWFYAAKLIWPLDLSFVYPRWEIRTDSWWAWLAAIAAICVPAAIAWRHRRASGPLVAVLCFAAILLPALGFVNIYPMRYTFVADHYQYLASLALLALVAAWWMQASAVDAGGKRWALRKLPLDVRRWIAAAILLASALLTLQRQSVFHDSRSLWSDTLRKNPTSMIANIQMGRLAAREGDLAAAEQYFRDGIGWRTDDRETHEFQTNLANAISRTGRLDEAAAEFDKALDLKPDYLEALNGLANVRARQGRLPAAIELYHKALATSPNNAIVRTNLGNALAETGHLAEAEREYEVASQLEPESVLARLALARVLAREGSFAKAEAECLEVLQLQPNLSPARQLLVSIRRDREQHHGVP